MRALFVEALVRVVVDMEDVVRVAQRRVEVERLVDEVVVISESPLHLLYLVGHSVAVLIYPAVVVRLDQNLLETAGFPGLFPVNLEHPELAVLRVVEVLSVAIAGAWRPDGLHRVE